MGMIRFTGTNSYVPEIWISKDQIVAVSSTLQGCLIHADGQVFEVAEPLPVALARLGIDPPPPRERRGFYPDPPDRV
jgi:hypothetical protein